MRKGFTLIELLVVISIISVLATIGLVVFSGVQKTAHDGVRKRDLHNLQIALTAYYHQNNRYPCSSTDSNPVWQSYGSNGQAWWISDTGCVSQDSNPILFDDRYMNRLPVDPKNNATYPWIGAGDYSYAYYSPTSLDISGCPTGNGQYYILVARLEQNDPDVQKPEEVKYCDGNPVIGTGIIPVGASEDVNNLLILTSQ